MDITKEKSNILMLNKAIEMFNLLDICGMSLQNRKPLYSNPHTKQQVSAYYERNPFLFTITNMNTCPCILYTVSCIQLPSKVLFNASFYLYMKICCI